MFRRFVEVKVGRRDRRVRSTEKKDLELSAYEDIVAFETGKIYLF
jgi:hypothetical protein